MTLEFLDLVQEGKNQWWRYALGLVFIVFSWMSATFFLFAVLGVWTVVDGDPQTYVNRSSGSFVGIDPFVTYLVLNLGHIAMLIGLLLTVRFLHKRPLLTLITGAGRIDWRRIGRGFGIYFSLIALLTLADYVLHPSNYRVTSHPMRMLTLAPIVLVLTPIQTTTEELVFRGYLLQAAGLITRRFWVPTVISSMLFMVPHLANPEVAHGFWIIASYYLGIGVLFALVTLRSNSSEFAIGAHASVNLFSALIVNYTDSALKTDSVFYCIEIDAAENLIAFIVVAVIFYVLLFGFRKHVPE